MNFIKFYPRLLETLSLKEAYYYCIQKEEYNPSVLFTPYQIRKLKPKIDGFRFNPKAKELTYLIPFQMVKEVGLVEAYLYLNISSWFNSATSRNQKCILHIKDFGLKVSDRTISRALSNLQKVIVKNPDGSESKLITLLYLRNLKLRGSSIGIRKLYPATTEWKRNYTMPNQPQTIKEAPGIEPTAKEIEEVNQLKAQILAMIDRLTKPPVTPLKIKFPSIQVAPVPLPYTPQEKPKPIVDDFIIYDVNENPFAPKPKNRYEGCIDDDEPIIPKVHKERTIAEIFGEVV